MNAHTSETSLDASHALEIPHGHLTRKQIILAHRLAAGDGITEASRAAGYCDHSMGSKAAKNPHVAALITEVRRRAAVTTGLTLEYVCSKHHEIIETSDDLAARQRSLAAVVDILDLRQVARDSGATRWQRLSDEDLDNELERLQRAVDVTPQLLPADQAG